MTASKAEIKVLRRIVEVMLMMMESTISGYQIMEVIVSVISFFGSYLAIVSLIKLV